MLGVLTQIRSQDTLPELVRRIKPSAVAIETFDSRGEALSRGSGFFIDTDRVVTNRHVIEGAYRAEVHSSAGTVYPVKGVLAVDAEGDLALLKVDAPANIVRPLSLERTSPQEGESIVVIGNPFGLEGSVTNGIVSAVRDIPTFGRIIQITAADLSRLERQPGRQHAGPGYRRGYSANHRRTKHQFCDSFGKDLAVADRDSDFARRSGSQQPVATSVQRRCSFFATALAFFRKTIVRKPCPILKRQSSPTAITRKRGPRRAFVNEKLGHHAEAIEASKKAVALRPAAESYFNIGLANFYLKQYRESADAYRQAIKLDPYNAADAYYALGLTYRDWAQPDEEIQAYKQAIKLKPDYTSAYERLGARYLRSKKYPEAIEIFKQLSILKPGNASAPNNMGEAYLELGKLNEALEAFKQAIRLKPDSGRAYFNLGKCYLAMGNRNAAIEQYNILQNIDPDWAEKLDQLINP